MVAPARFDRQSHTIVRTPSCAHRRAHTVVVVRPGGAWHAEAMRIVLVVALVLGTAAHAAAHMVVLPEQSASGGMQRYTVVVPTEGRSATVRISLRIPMGMEVAAVEAKPG